MVHTMMAGAAKNGRRPAVPRPRAGAGQSRSPVIEERIVGGAARGAGAGVGVTGSGRVSFSAVVTFSAAVTGDAAS